MTIAAVPPATRPRAMAVLHRAHVEGAGVAGGHDARGGGGILGGHVQGLGEVAARPPRDQAAGYRGADTMRARRTWRRQVAGSQPEADPQQPAADWCESG